MKSLLFMAPTLSIVCNLGKTIGSFKLSILFLKVDWIFHGVFSDWVTVSSQDLQSFVCKSVKEIEHVMNVGNQNRAVG